MFQENSGKYWEILGNIGEKVGKAGKSGKKRPIPSNLSKSLKVWIVFRKIGSMFSLNLLPMVGSDLGHAIRCNESQPLNEH